MILSTNYSNQEPIKNIKSLENPVRDPNLYWSSILSIKKVKMHKKEKKSHRRRKLNLTQITTQIQSSNLKRQVDYL